VRIGVITNVISPYRTPVFEQLAKRPGCDLLVVYEAATEPNRRWSADAELPFRHELLLSWTLDLRVIAPHAYAFIHVPRNPLAALARFRADAVVAWGGGIWSSPANLAALAARGRRGWALVPSWEGFASPTPSRPRRLAEPWVRRFMRSGDAWLAWGRRAADDVVRLGATPARVVGAPQVALPLPAADARRGRRDRALLYVGHLTERKGVPHLLEAMRRLPDTELWIAGDGPLRPEVEAAAARGLRVTLHGHLDPAGLAGLYARAAALVLPSLNDVWGLVVNEAVATGTPVVTTDQVAAADELVEHDVTGYVVPAADSDALADALVRVLGWDDRRRAAGARRGHELLAPFTFEAAAAAIATACEIGITWRRNCRR
jgi:glycosyltransferase involved in cell wall biosynthesis